MNFTVWAVKDTGLEILEEFYAESWDAAIERGKEHKKDHNELLIAVLFK